MKKFCFFVMLLAIVAIVLVGCGGIDKCSDPALDADCYYRRVDPSYDSFRSTQEWNDFMDDRATQIALDPVPTAVPTYSAPTPVYASTLIFCTEVVEGDIFSTAIERANGGSMPPYIFQGLAMQVMVKHDEAKQVLPLESAMADQTPVIYPGDLICVSTYPQNFEDK